MKVRIHNNSSWYKVGDIFETEEKAKRGYYIVKNTEQLIYVANCEIIPDEPKIQEKEYKVIKPFTILDVYKARPKRPKRNRKFEEFFESLLEDCYKKKYLMTDIIISFERMKASATLMENLPMLEEFGFIEEKIKDVELVPGMKLKWRHDDQYTYLVTEDIEVFSIKSGIKITIKRGTTTLNELNKQHDEGFEAADEVD